MGEIISAVEIDIDSERAVRVDYPAIIVNSGVREASLIHKFLASVVENESVVTLMRIGLKDNGEIGAEVERDVLLAREFPANLEDVVANPDEVESIFNFERSRVQLDVVARGCDAPFLLVVVWVSTQFNRVLKSRYSSMIPTRIRRSLQTRFSL